MPAKEALVATFKDDAPPEVAGIRMIGDGVWVAELDMRHVKDAIDAQWENGIQNDMNHALSVSRLYAQWGYPDEAVKLLTLASSGISTESQDTILPAQAQRIGEDLDFGQLLHSIVVAQQLREIIDGLEAKTVSAEAAAKRIFKVSAGLDRPSVRADQHVMEMVSVAAELIAEHVKGKLVRERLTAIAKSWRLKAQTMAALNGGILDNE
jgi:hypothetical protein